MNTLKKFIPQPIKNILKRLLGRKNSATNADIMPAIKEAVRGDIVSVLDVGCGRIWDGNDKNEDILFSIFDKPNFKITGIDVFPECIEWRRQNGPSGEYLVMDARNIDTLSNSFDLVICHHVLEHFSKDESEKLLVELEKKAAKQVIVGTPIGFTNTEYAVEIHGNEHERHLCGWEPDEFRNRGYAVTVIKNVLIAVKNIG
ncbi:MAG: class I SAM-dependent methyltransferase [bacterium]